MNTFAIPTEPKPTIITSEDIFSALIDLKFEHFYGCYYQLKNGVWVDYYYF